MSIDPPRRARHTFHFPPAAPLRAYVERIWGWDEHEWLRLPLVTPGLGAELFFHHGAPPRVRLPDADRELARGHLLCVRRVPLQLSEQRDVGFTAVRIRAGALGRFTRAPLSDLIDAQLGVREIWGRAGADAADRVAEAKSEPERVRIIENFLLERLAETTVDLIAERALRLIYDRSGPMSVAKLAEHCALGRRQFERRMLGYFGQSAVELRCLARFYHVARRLALDPSRDLLRSALDAGYYDQAHCIREFKRFAGMTPQAFQREAAGMTHFYNPPTGAIAKLGFTPRSNNHDSAAR